MASAHPFLAQSLPYQNMLRYSLIPILLILPLLTLSQTPRDITTPPQIEAADTIGQTDLIDIFLKVTRWKIKAQKRVKGKKVYYSLLPFGKLPGGATALVTTTQAGFYLGHKKTTWLSTVTFSPSMNFKGQFNIPFSANIWSPQNAWNYQGQLRYSYIPTDTWGIGGQSVNNDNLRINYSYIRLYASALKKIKPYFFAGLGYNLDYHINIRPADDTSSIQHFTQYAYGTANRSNSISSGPTLNLLFDTRVNSVNPLPGFYANLILRSNPDFLSSGKAWYSLYADSRKYVTLSQKGQNVLAFWAFAWTTLGSAAPYLNLPAIGWDAEQRSGRGIYSRRYTGNTLLYVETEYRRDITNNGLLGFVVFANVNTVTEQDTRRFAYLHPAAGAGLRIKFNKKTATNVGIDVGFSKGHNGLYFSLGETF